MLLARRSTLAMAAVLDIALHARPEPVPAKAIAQRLALPARHLEPLLQELVRSRILRGIRGPKGGYELARERRRISVADILRASLRGDAASEPLPALLEHVVGPVATEIGESVLARFETVSVEDLCMRARVQTSASAGAEPADFAI